MKYFKDEEFSRCNPSCDVSQMDASFLALLDAIREISGVPMHLTCAYRSAAHDRQRGRSGRGYHTLGRAVDVSCCDGPARARFIAAALQLGCSVGIYPTFLHFDNRPNQIVFYGK